MDDFMPDGEFDPEDEGQYFFFSSIFFPRSLIVFISTGIFGLDFRQREWGFQLVCIFTHSPLRRKTDRLLPT